MSEQRLEIEAVDTPHACSAVMKVPGEQIQHELQKKGLQLADFTDNGINPELSVPIGAGYYWKMVAEKVERLTETLEQMWPVSTSSVTEATCMFIPLEEEIIY